MADIKAFNSEEYGFIDLQVVMLGRPVSGLRGLRYKEMQEKRNTHGAGRKPVARVRGPINYEGSVKILLSELRAMLQSQGVGASVVTIRPFDIIASWAPRIGDAITTDRLAYVEFTECEVNVNQGDQEIEVELPVIIGDIQWNV